jgi:hypothetical protein
MGGIVDMVFGGGSDAPAPDPKIGEAASANAAVAKESLDFYKTIYERDIAPAQKRDLDMREALINDTRSSLAQQKKFAEEQNAYYKDTFQPIEKQMAKEAMEYDSDANVNRRMGIASANVNQQFSNARGQGMRALSRYGIGLNPEAFARENQKLTTSQALASSGAQTGAAFETQDKGIALRAGAANFGRNMPNTAATYYANTNNTANTASGISSGGINNIATGTGVMGQGFNTAIAGNQSSGNLMLGDFNARMQGYVADQNLKGSMFEGLGTAAGMAYAKKADGGIVEGTGGPREDNVPIMASSGEFVLNEGAVKHFGLAKLNKMNEVGLQNQERRGLIRRA